MPLNRAIGIQVELGAKVVDLTIAPSGPHTVVWERGGVRLRGDGVALGLRRPLPGRRQVLRRKLGPEGDEGRPPEHRRGRGALPERRGRGRGERPGVEGSASGTRRGTSRRITSCTTGTGSGLIPLAQDLMSVGVVYDKGPDSRTGRARARRWRRSSIATARRATPRKGLGSSRTSRKLTPHPPPSAPTSYFSADRWAATGEAGAFHAIRSTARAPTSSRPRAISSPGSSTTPDESGCRRAGRRQHDGRRARELERPLYRAHGARERRLQAPSASRASRFAANPVSDLRELPRSTGSSTRSTSTTTTTSSTGLSSPRS